MSQNGRFAGHSGVVFNKTGTSAGNFDGGAGDYDGSEFVHGGGRALLYINSDLGTAGITSFKITPLLKNYDGTFKSIIGATNTNALATAALTSQSNDTFMHLGFGSTTYYTQFNLPPGDYKLRVTVVGTPVADTACLLSLYSWQD